MKIWSIHPKYLDADELKSLWNEAVLAQDVLAGRVEGKEDPQMDRFKSYKEPVTAMSIYLRYIFLEAKSRGLKLSKSQIFKWHKPKEEFIRVKKSQVQSEIEALKRILKTKDKRRYQALLQMKRIKLHPIFKV